MVSTEAAARRRDGGLSGGGQSLSRQTGQAGAAADLRPAAARGGASHESLCWNNFSPNPARSLQGIGEKLMQLEDAPKDQADLMNELFRFVHTLKGNSGLFAFPEMTRVLHAGEDLMDAVRNGEVAYSRQLADRLLDAMDFVGLLCDEIESTECIDASHAADSQNMADALRSLMTSPNQDEIAAQASISRDASSTITRVPASPAQPPVSCPPPLGSIPEAARIAALRQCQQNDRLHWITYRPERECFFHGDDPLNCARRTPGLMWGCVLPSEPLPPLAELDTYRCLLDFHLLTAASREELAEYFRYIPDQVDISAVHPLWLVIPQGDLDGSPVEADFLVDATRLLEAGDTAALKQRAQTALDCSRDGSWFASVLRWLLCLLDTDENIDGMAQNSRALRLLIQSIATATPPDWTGSDSSGSISAKLSGCIAEAPPDANSPEVLPQDDQAAFNQILAAQRQILLLDDQPAWHTGRLKAVAAVLANLSQAVGNRSARSEIQSALDKSLSTGRNAPLLAWLDARNNRQPEPCLACLPGGNDHGEAGQVDGSAQASPASKNSPDKAPADEEIKFGRRGEDSLAVPKTLKVDQAKIDRLMNLIGELVVEKNALPYLAKRAESQFGVRELSREIKGHYSVINRIADEMQDAIMQVRMMPVSFIFQRFPAHGARHLPQAGQGSSTGARRGRDRSRQEHHRVAGRPAYPHRPQQPGSRPGDAGGPSCRGQTGHRQTDPSRRAGDGPRHHRDYRRWQRHRSVRNQTQGL